MRRRRCEEGQVDVVSAERQVEAERDGGVRLHPLQVARPSRQGQRQGDEGQAVRGDGCEIDAFRRQTHDLRRLQGDGRGVGFRLRLPPPSYSPLSSLIPPTRTGRPTPPVPPPRMLPTLPSSPARAPGPTTWPTRPPPSAPASALRKVPSE